MQIIYFRDQTLYKSNFFEQDRDKGKWNTVKPRNLLILGPSKIVPQIAKSADCECYCT